MSKEVNILPWLYCVRLRLSGNMRRFVGRYAAAAVSILWMAIWANIAIGQPTLTDPGLQLETFASGLSLPTTIAFLAPGDALVLQKNNGQVRRVVSGVLQPAPVLDIAVNPARERGLLGIAINQEEPPKVFLYYTPIDDPDGDGQPDTGAPIGNRVYRYTWNAAANGGAGMLEDPQLILDLPIFDSFTHVGGMLVIGPTPAVSDASQASVVGDDSVLYVAIGDLEQRGQLQNRPGGPPPNDNSVIFRILQDGSAATGNPFTPYCSETTTQVCPDGGACPSGETCVTEVARYFAYGVRNTFGMTLDPLTGFLWDTENGQDDFDEVNVVAQGFNSGWTQIMGPDSRDPQGVGDLFNMPGSDSIYSDPEFSWLTPIGVTAILFPVGSLLGPTYDDMALVGDFNNGQVYRFPLNAQRDGFDFGEFPDLVDLVADSATERDALRLGSGFGQVTDLKLGPDGAVYVVSFAQGTVYRIRSKVTTTPTATPPPTLTATVTSSVTATATVTPIPTNRPSTTPITPIVSGINGRVRYYEGGRAVADVSVELRGDETLNTPTNSDGEYSFNDLASATWQVVPEKAGERGNGISALDAAFVLQTNVGERPFTSFQELACDVSGNGVPATLDASRILQYRVGTLDRFEVAESCASDWVFVPDPESAPNRALILPEITTGNCQPGTIVFDPLVGETANQDFVAILFGDCTGNWRAQGDNNGQTVGQVRLETLRRAPGRRARLPIYVDTTEPFFAVEVELEYDETALAVRRVRRGGAVFGALMEFNETEPGRLRIALASGEAIESTAGPILIVEFELMNRDAIGADIRAVRGEVDERPVELKARAGLALPRASQTSATGEEMEL